MSLGHTAHGQDTRWSPCRVAFASPAAPDSALQTSPSTSETTFGGCRILLINSVCGKMKTAGFPADCFAVGQV